LTPSSVVRPAPVERTHDQTGGAREIMGYLQPTISQSVFPRCRVNTRMLTLLSSMPQNIVKYLNAKEIAEVDCVAIVRRIARFRLDPFPRLRF
jgi:hypothetical protein